MKYLNKISALKISNVSKIYNKNFYAVKNVNFEIKYGEIHCLVGENGAGKSTLVKLLSGAIPISEGVFSFQGQELKEYSSKLAKDLRIGLIQQHFPLIDDFSVYENIILGFEQNHNEETISKHNKLYEEIYDLDKYFNRKKNALTELGLAEIIRLRTWLKNELKTFHIDQKATKIKINELIKSLNFRIDLNTKVKELSVPNRQKVEILKVLFQDANIILFDESTSMLNNHEVDFFLKSLKAFKAQGKAILFITHKINEILRVADKITVLSRGKVSGKFYSNISKVTPEMIIEKMIDSDSQMKTVILNKKNPFKQTEQPIISVKRVTKTDNTGKKLLNDFSLKVYPGEIVAIAGIEGHGQKILLEVVAGIEKDFTGDVIFKTEKQKKWQKHTLDEIRQLGIFYTPRDRITESLLINESLGDNIVFNELYSSNFFTNWPMNVMNDSAINQRIEQIIKEYDVRGVTDSENPISYLSGGNQQKFLVGRELVKNPNLILLNEPTWGVDPNSIKGIFNKLIGGRNNKMAVLVAFQDINDIIALADRAIVISKGKKIKEIKNLKKNGVFQEIVKLMTT